MRPPKSPSSEPCNECRSQSALSHMKAAFRRKPGLRVKEATEYRSPSYTQHSPSSEECPRIVPPEIAAKRIGNPPRRAALPVPRPGAINPALQQRSTTRSVDSPWRSKSALERNEDYPYVRESEVSQHLDAIRAGAPSPLVDFARAARRKKTLDPITDFSETVFYGQKFSAAFTNSAEQRQLSQPSCSNLVVEGYLETGGHVVVERPRPEQQASIDAQLYHSSVHPRLSPQQSHRQSRASRRSADSRHRTRRRGSEEELKTNDQLPDFEEGSAYDEMPRLRGGGGGDGNVHTSGCGLMMKQLLLTCHRPGHGYDTDSGSDENLPPARTHNIAEVAQALRRAHGTSRLPRGISRGYGSQETPRTGRSASGGGDATNLPTSRTASFAARYPQPRSVFSYMSLFRLASVFARPANPSVDAPAVAANDATLTATLRPAVSLRGGAGSPSALRDHERVPPTLFWLAGGKGKPITTASWKSQKPKRRMGGVFGMALHGLDAGTEYGSRKYKGDDGSSSELPRHVAVAVEVSKPATKEKAESVKSGMTYSSRLSSSSRSSTKSNSSRSSNSHGSAAAVGEVRREVPLDPVPEEAAAPAIDPPPADPAAAEGTPVQVSGEEAPPADDAQRGLVDDGAHGAAPAPNEVEHEHVGQAAVEGDGRAHR
ncbi:hypothetical protein BKA58DRAFT_129408 [Alternaria rosae]|uniref:uncharacterized protein n=1 Tax=Alternaria rosae TaxID=1187941 RepID=UPI001E8E1B87|nr:uncharacterized protein BKA58DRAFT_129408 [Alternaria rosae]KAH6875825.1 hypothetical protein BKA58DRAFT_129408 [Alternaria rosae]